MHRRRRCRERAWIRFVSWNTPTGALRCKSAQEEKCPPPPPCGARAPRFFQALGTTSFFRLPPPWWEILGGAKQPQSYKAEGQNETRCDKFLNCLVRPSVCRLLPGRSRDRKNPHPTAASCPAFTVLQNPSQLQSVTIKSLINATGKRRSELGGLEMLRTYS